MPWVYRQSTGDLSFNGEWVERGYSGTPAGKNNPAMQAVPYVGPRPRGSYRIGPPHSSANTGMYSLNLTPAVNTNTFGRSDFRIGHAGAKATVDAMSETQWSALLIHIDAGSAAWIALAPKLAGGANSGRAEDLGIGLAYALPKNARAVLSAIDSSNGPVLGVSRVCPAPFIEDTVADIPAYPARQSGRDPGSRPLAARG